MSAADIESINLGDVVFLKCGGPNMVVTKIEKQSRIIEAAWIDSSGKPRAAGYPWSAVLIRPTNPKYT